MKNNLPLILPQKGSKPVKSFSEINLDTSSTNSFGSRFSKLKQAYLSSNKKTIKKSSSQNSYGSEPLINEEQKLKQNEDSENDKRQIMLEDAVFRADYITKFKKIKLNLYKNKYFRNENMTTKKNEIKDNNVYDLNKKRGSLTTITTKKNTIEEDKYIFEKNLWSSDINIKNDLNYDIGGKNEADSDDDFELEPERYKYREIKPITQNVRDKKINNKRNILYITELQNSKNSSDFSSPIKNKRSNINDKINKNSFNIKQIKIIPDKIEKYKNPFEFKQYSSLNNISHFHKVYRSFKNICRKHYVKANSPSFVFIKSCEKERIICNPLGLIKRWGEESSLDMNNQHTGDKYVNCISSSLKYVDHINSLEMSNNRITSKSIEKLFNNIKQNENLIKNLVKLNLSFNNIREKGVEQLIDFIEDKNCQLENLNLEGNNLGDKNINNLCLSISQYLGNKLTSINLGKNKITKNSERGLLSLTSDCSELVVLILRNNQINNSLAAKMVINLKNLYSLKILDFSWNLIGDHLIYPFLYEEAVNFYPNQKNVYNNFELDKIKMNMKIIFNKNPLLPKIDNQNAKSKNKNETNQPEIKEEIKKIKVPQRNPSAFAVEFSSYIKNTLCQLIHVNISHNNLPYIDCELIAKESKYNRNILGFHVDGNEMKIDQYGFIIPIKKEQKKENFFSQSQMLYEPENYKDIPQVLISPINKIRNSNNCWVCECWNEVEFSLDVNNKDIRPKYIVVKLHLDFENYAPCDMIYKKKNFKLVRMCPPGKVQYFFTVDGNPVYNCYKEFDYKIKEFEKPIKYTFNEEYIEQYNSVKIIKTESGDVNSNNNVFNKSNINKNYFGGDVDIDIQEDQKDKNNKLISKTIYVYNFGVRYVPPNNNIITKEYQSTLKFSIPRPENYSSRNKKQNPWKYSDSIWSYYKYNLDGETDEIIDRMFETDFNMSEYDQIFINEKEYIRAKEILKENYKKILNCYINLSSYSGSNVWQITSKVLMDWLEDKCDEFIDEEYNTKKIDKILEDLYYNKKEVELRGRYKRYFPSNYYNLIRHSFMFFLVEIAIDKFINLKHQTESPLEALELAMNNFFSKGFDNYEYNSWRKERYYNEEMDNYIKAFIPLIDGIFHTYSKKLKERRERELKERKSLIEDTSNITSAIDINLINENEIKMTQEDFTNLVMSFARSDEIDMHQLPFIFHISKKLNVNETSNDNFLYLNFEEFCEALCRVIDMYSPFPPEDKKDEWPMEKRKEQFLIEKMENIMPDLFKKINHPKFNYIRDKFISPLKNQVTSLYIIDYKSNFYKGYESILEQNKIIIDDNINNI